MPRTYHVYVNGSSFHKKLVTESKYRQGSVMP
jgi:hypothetical protein